MDDGGTTAAGNARSGPAHGGLTQPPARQQLRPNGARATSEGGAGRSGRRQRSTSCSREQRKEAAKAAAAGDANDEAGLRGTNAAAVGEGSGAAAQAGAELGAGTTQQVHIGTDGSDIELDSSSDADLWSDGEVDGAADVDVDAQGGETEEQRRARIASFFKQRMQERAKRAREARRGKDGPRRGVRKPRKGE